MISKDMQRHNIRMPELDYMRAVAMIFVVMGHVLIMGLNSKHTALLSLIVFCEMPIFFIVSGFLARVDKTSRLLDTLKYFVSRSFSLLIPLVTWSLIRNISDGEVWGGGIITILYRRGYWFFYALWWCMLLTSMANSICSFLQKYFKTYFINYVLYVIIYLMFVLLKFSSIDLEPFVPTHDMLFYFPFYAMGIIIQTNLFCKKILFNKYIFACSLIGFLICWKLSAMDSFIIWIIGALCSVIVIWNTCKNINPQLLVSKILGAIGRNTLAIYAIHYFFIIQLPDVLRNSIFLQNNFFPQVVFSSFYAIIAIFLSLIFDRIISCNSITRFLFFGEKKKRRLVLD